MYVFILITHLVCVLMKTINDLKLKWIMAIQISFKYCIDTKDHKPEEKIKAIVVEGTMQPKL